MATTATTGTVDVDGLRVAYRELGAGPAVLLLHGWPTSSYLWREVMVPIARSNRAVAVDLPGFGASDKPLDRRYDFALFERTIEVLLAELGIDRTAIAVHDLGGPVGVRWAIRNPQRVTRLARSEEHTSELQSHHDLVCRLLLEKKKKKKLQRRNTTKKKTKKQQKINNQKT